MVMPAHQKKHKKSSVHNIKSVMNTRYGKSTARGYNAPCFEHMVHYCMGSVLIAPGQSGQKGQTLDSACHPK